MKSKLHNNETILLETNYHWSTYLKTTFYLAGSILLLGYWLDYFFIFILFSTGLLVYKNHERLSKNWIITNKRIIFEKGLLSSESSEINIDKITSINHQQSFKEKNWGYGTLTIHLGNKESIILKNIANSLEFKNALSFIIHKD